MLRLRISMHQLAVCLIFASLASCAKQDVHIHDRHSLSYPVVEDFSKKHKGTTLVLIDYHHDAGPRNPSILSSNWAGKLLKDGAVDRMLWVSGRDLLLPNRNARIAWLRRKLRTYAPSDAAAIEKKITLADWHALENERISGPLVVSVDFDSFCHDPGEPPERFVDEIAAWTARQKPAVLTLALSATYQKDASFAWKCLDRFVAEYSRAAPHSAWFLEAGRYGEKPEGTEETLAWRAWAGDREKFGRRNSSFLPGAHIWTAAPVDFRNRLLALSVKAGDAAGADVIKGWSGDATLAMERRYPESATDGLLASAAASLESSWSGKPPAALSSGSDDFGLAVRIQSDGGDRGCFAIYRGLTDLPTAAAYCARFAAKDPRYSEVSAAERDTIDLEVSVFGPWDAMKNPEDFLPGLDSLLLKDGGSTTLLQAPVAAERGYDRDEFLSRLSNKAGLGLDGWKRPGLEFYRSRTVWSRRSLQSIEASATGSSAASQKNEKK